MSGAPGRSRTLDQRLRRPLLYPTELLALNFREVLPSDLRFNGRGERIRTSDSLRPRQVRYQAALRPAKAAVM